MRSSMVKLNDGEVKDPCSPHDSKENKDQLQTSMGVPSPSMFG